MKNRFYLMVLSLFMQSFYASAQSGSPVLIEVFTETGCGACAANDSVFEALIKANEEKVAVISYHCFYTIDTFYQYNKACDLRYDYYKIHGFPSAMTNGKQPIPSSGHLSYVNASLINSLYSKEPAFKIEISSASKGKKSTHISDIKVKATALKDNSSKDLRLYVVVTENNINYEERYHEKSVNGLINFDHIMRAILPSQEGTPIDIQKAGKVNTVKVLYTNNDKEINYKEVRIVVFIQDQVTQEVFGAAVTKEHPFQ